MNTLLLLKYMISMVFKIFSLLLVEVSDRYRGLYMPSA